MDNSTLILPYPKPATLLLEDIPESARQYENRHDCWAMIQFSDDEQPQKTFLWRSGDEFHVMRE